MQKGSGLGGKEEDDTHWSRTENNPLSQQSTPGDSSTGAVCGLRGF